MTKLKNPNADLVATRDLDLRRRVERLATLDERKPAQMTRILLRRAIEQKEEELGLPPIDEQAA